MNNNDHSVKGLIAINNRMASIFPQSFDVLSEATLTRSQCDFLVETIDNKYSQPEYLYMDGERSASAARKIAKQLAQSRAILASKILFA